MSNQAPQTKVEQTTEVLTIEYELASISACIDADERTVKTGDIRYERFVSSGKELETDNFIVHDQTTTFGDRASDPTVRQVRDVSVQLKNPPKHVLETDGHVMKLTYQLRIEQDNISAYKLVRVRRGNRSEDLTFALNDPVKEEELCRVFAVAADEAQTV